MRPLRPRPVRLIAFAFACQLVAGCAPATPPDLTWEGATEICPDGATIEGIDVSYWQGTIDWNAVAGDGIEFAFIRVSDGLTYYDTQFQTNWAGARNAGLVRGAYQYFRPGEDAVDQAELLLSEMGPLQAGDLPPTLDVETTDGYSAAHISAAIHDWMDTVESETGRMPIIYTGPWFWESSVGSWDFEDYPLWVAHWFATCPDTPDQWNHWEFWQTSAHGSVDGISGAVDTDVFNGDLGDLLDFAEGTAECGDGICNGEETADTCPEDCPSCEPVPADGRVIDETDECFTAGGNPQWWRTEDDGFADSLLWTHTTDSADVDNHGIWDLDLDEAGTYRVQAWTAAPWAESQQASYELRHGRHPDHSVVDQSATDGWNTLGEFEFAAGGDQWIRLDDNTGEPYGDLVQIVFDAVQLTRLDGTGDDDDVAGDDDTTGSDDDDAGDDDSQQAPPGPPNRGDDDDGGCGCRASGVDAGWSALLLLGLGLYARRRVG